MLVPALARLPLLHATPCHQHVITIWPYSCCNCCILLCCLPPDLHCCLHSCASCLLLLPLRFIISNAEQQPGPRPQVSLCAARLACAVGRRSLHSILSRSSPLRAPQLRAAAWYSCSTTVVATTDVAACIHLKFGAPTCKQSKKSIQELYMNCCSLRLCTICSSEAPTEQH